MTWCIATSDALPKAHLHLHFTGSMRHETLLELAARDGISLPDSLVSEWPPQLSAPTRRAGSGSSGSTTWRARCCARRPTCAGWCSRRPRTTSATGAGGWRSRSTRAGTPRGSAASPPSPTWCSTPCGTPASGPASASALVVAANRTRHPLDARTLARLAAQYAGRGVIGFGLSNDERRGRTARLRAGASAIAERAGLLLVPHGGRAARPRPHPHLPRRPARGAARARRPRGRGPGRCSTGSSTPASRSRCARSPTWRSASTAT